MKRRTKGEPRYKRERTTDGTRFTQTPTDKRKARRRKANKIAKASRRANR